MIFYSFCETVTAGPASRWHIRKLTSVGQKFGGGADTKALCGRTVSWDLKSTVEPKAALDHGCRECCEIYLELENVVIEE